MLHGSTSAVSEPGERGQLRQAPVQRVSALLPPGLGVAVGG
jgi:hypothetical protein